MVCPDIRGVGYLDSDAAVPIGTTAWKEGVTQRILVTCDDEVAAINSRQGNQLRVLNVARTVIFIWWIGQEVHEGGSHLDLGLYPLEGDRHRDEGGLVEPGEIPSSTTSRAISAGMQWRGRRARPRRI